MTAAELERSLREKNDLRRASGLPLCDVEKELARFHADQQAAAYAAFVPCPPQASYDGVGGRAAAIIMVGGSSSIRAVFALAGETAAGHRTEVGRAAVMPMRDVGLI